MTATPTPLRELPALPEPLKEVAVSGYHDGTLRPALEDYYDADQMRAYAEAALSARDEAGAVGEVRIENGCIVSTSIKRPLADGGYDVVPQVATPPASGEAGADGFAQVCDALGIGADARTVGGVLTNIRNLRHFADCLHAIEREFFMAPGEPDDEFPDDEPEPECLVNSWGSTREQYVEQFRSAIRRLAAVAPPAASGDDTEQIREQASAWEAVFKTLLEVAPGWHYGYGCAMDKACDTIRRLAAVAPAGMDGWQPIETVPRDGRPVVVWMHDGRFSSASYNAHSEPQATHWVIPTPPATAGKE